MVLPVGRTVRLVLTSPDVIHSFWVPRFLVKRDLIPGVTNEIDVDVRRRGARSTGRCAEFCGLDHWEDELRGPGGEPADYRDWLAEQQRRAERSGRPRDRSPPSARHRRRPPHPPPRHDAGILRWLDDHRPQAHRHQLHGHGVRLLPASAGCSRSDRGRSWPSPTRASSSPDTYNQLFTMHGSIMLFLFVVPFAFGLANYLVPAADRRAATWRSRGSTRCATGCTCSAGSR